MILVVGESLVDLVVRGDRLPEPHVGGSPLNVSIGLARLGAPVTLGTTLGNDAHGAMIRSHLAQNQVPVVEMAPMAPSSSVATAKLNTEGVATYDFSINWAPTTMAPIGADVTALHTGSLATALDPGAELVLASLAKQSESDDVTLTYDPNVRPALLGDRDDARGRVESVVGLVDVVKASDEDLQWLYPGRSYADIAAAWLALGPSMVVVTRGPNGAYAVTSSAQAELATSQVDVVDTVGAGDSFMAGLLYSLQQLEFLGGKNSARLREIDAATLELLLARAVEVATITVGRAGADPPTIREVSFGANGGSAGLA